MTKEQLIKELELLADSCMSNYALETNGYNRGVLDALDVVNKYFVLAAVSSSVCTCKNAELEKHSLAAVYCLNCDAYVQTDF